MIITPIDHYKLYCTSDTITDILNNSSPFCIISGMLIYYCHVKLRVKSFVFTILGAVFHYLLLNITLWWFFHVCSIFYKVMFPLKAKQYERKDKYIHLVLFLAGKQLTLILISHSQTRYPHTYTRCLTSTLSSRLGLHNYSISSFVMQSSQ